MAEQDWVARAEPADTPLRDGHQPDHDDGKDDGPPTGSSSQPSSPTKTPDSLINLTSSRRYWSEAPATVTGMLGGYSQISRIDLQGSRNFLSNVRRRHANGAFRAGGTKRRLRLGVDCGAGIGRITDGLLMDVCERVDAVEPIAKFADRLRNESKAATQRRLGDVYVMGLEDWTPNCPSKTRYDLIWVQWCLGHLPDRQLVDFLTRCRQCLLTEEEEDEGEEPLQTGQGGWIVVKENISTHPDGQDIYDDLDSTVTRTDAKFRQLFDAAGLVVARSDLQTGFPKALGLFPVRMYALRPWA